MSSEERKEKDINLETDASSWLTTLSIREEGYILSNVSGICYLSGMAGD